MSIFRKEMNDGHIGFWTNTKIKKIDWKKEFKKQDDYFKNLFNDILTNSKQKGK